MTPLEDKGGSESNRKSSALTFSQSEDYEVSTRRAFTSQVSYEWCVLSFSERRPRFLILVLHAPLTVTLNHRLTPSVMNLNQSPSGETVCMSADREETAASQNTQCSDAEVAVVNLNSCLFCLMLFISSLV